MRKLNNEIKDESQESAMYDEIAATGIKLTDKEDEEQKDNKKQKFHKIPKKQKKHLSFR